MKIEVGVTVHDGREKQLDRIEWRLEELSGRVDHIISQEKTMSGELQALQAKVAANTSVIESALTLIQGFKAALDAAIAAGNPAALTALSAELGSEDDKLAAAVAANTPGPAVIALPDGAVGVALPALAPPLGTAPFSFTLTGGALPPGCALDLTNGNLGTPSAGGDFAFMVHVADSDAATTDEDRSYTLHVA